MRCIFSNGQEVLETMGMDRWLGTGIRTNYRNQGRGEGLGPRTRGQGQVPASGARDAGPRTGRPEPGPAIWARGKAQGQGPGTRDQGLGSRTRAVSGKFLVMSAGDVRVSGQFVVMSAGDVKLSRHFDICSISCFCLPSK